MNYVQWNNALGRSLFNEHKEDLEVYIYFTKENIIRIGKDYGIQGEDDEIFQDFINALNFEWAYGSDSILEKASRAYEKGVEKGCYRIDGVIIEYPLYLSYLVLFVLPLTENYESNVNSTNSYYSLLKDFLNFYGLPELPQQNINNNWNFLWEHLEYWSYQVNEGKIGIFRARSIRNNWVYAGKPLAQVVFPPRSIKLLPEFFEHLGLGPGDAVEEEDFRRYLVDYGEELLGLSEDVINSLEKGDDLSNSVLNRVRETFKRWEGNDQENLEYQGNRRKDFSNVSLRLCIEGNDLKGYRFYYRLFATQEYPEDLSFNVNGNYISCEHSRNGWSKPLTIPFRDEDFTLEDSHNKWRAKFKGQSLRYFAKGELYGIRGWVEVKRPEGLQNLVMVGAREPDKVNTLPLDKDENVDMKADLSNQHFFYVTRGLRTEDRQKKVKIKGGLKIDTNTWLKCEVLPSVYIENGDGDETPFLRYERINEEISLIEYDKNNLIWKLPGDIRADDNFLISTGGKNAVNSGYWYKVSSSGFNIEGRKEGEPLLFDRWGEVINNDSPQTTHSHFFYNDLCLESEELNESRRRQGPYELEFKPLSDEESAEEKAGISYKPDNEILLHFLTSKGTTGEKNYCQACRTVYEHNCGNEEEEKQSSSIPKLSRLSLQYLDQLGYINYDYNHNNKITVNPPKLVYIPTPTGRKALLIGGRTPDLVHKLKDKLDQLGLSLIFEEQDPSLKTFFLPYTVIVQGNSSLFKSKVPEVAKELSIEFERHDLLQFKLLYFSGSISEYEKKLETDWDTSVDGWTEKVFDPDEITFKKIDGSGNQLDPCLIEYKLNEYDFTHKLWKGEVPYKVSKDWGRYLILRHFGKQPLLHDRDKKLLAVPLSLPLPKLIAKAFALMSGKAPLIEPIKTETGKRRYHFFQNIPDHFVNNILINKLGNIVQHCNLSI